MSFYTAIEFAAIYWLLCIAVLWLMSKIVP